MNTMYPTAGTTDASHFSERDFEQLAAAIDGIASTQRELFLTKLVILLAARGPAGTLADCMGRARMHLESNNEETS